MYRNLTHSELADTIISSQKKLNKSEKWELITELSRRGLNIGLEDLFALSLRHKDNLLELLYKKCSFSKEHLSTLRQKLVDYDLSSLVLKFVEEMRSGKYVESDIERLFQIIDNKVPGAFSFGEFKAVVLADAKVAITQTDIAQIDDIIREKGVEPIDAILLYYFEDEAISTNTRTGLITALECKRLINDSSESLEALKKHSADLNAKQLELELLEASEAEFALLTKRITATEKAISFLSPRVAHQEKGQPITKAKSPSSQGEQSMPTPPNKLEQDNSKGYDSDQKEKDVVARLLAGEVTLWKTYWIGNVGVGLVLSFIWKAINGTLDSGLSGILYIVWLFWAICISIGTWKSANKYTGNRIWAVLAKVAVVIGWIGAAIAALGAVGGLRATGVL